MNLLFEIDLRTVGPYCIIFIAGSSVTYKINLHKKQTAPMGAGHSDKGPHGMKISSGQSQQPALGSYCLAVYGPKMGTKRFNVNIPNIRPYPT